MKKSLLFVIMIMVTIYLMSSCKKDPNGQSEATNQITIGNYEGMEVHTIDTIEWQYDEYTPYYDYYEYIAYKSSINIDGIGSFGVQTFLSRNPIASLITDPLNYYEIKLVSSDLAFHYNLFKNNVYYHADSTIVQTDSVTLVYIDAVSSCNQINEFDQLTDSDVYNILVKHDKDEVLSEEDGYQFYGDYWEYPAQLFTSSSVFPTFTFDTANVTVYESYTDTSVECLNFPLDEVFYLGFKRSNDDEERLGWIKLIIEPNEKGHYIPKPLEVAIQK